MIPKDNSIVIEDTCAQIVIKFELVQFRDGAHFRQEADLNENASAWFFIFDALDTFVCLL